MGDEQAATVGDWLYAVALARCDAALDREDGGTSYYVRDVRPRDGDPDWLDEEGRAALEGQAAAIVHAALAHAVAVRATAYVPPRGVEYFTSAAAADRAWARLEEHPQASGRPEDGDPSGDAR